MEKQQPFSLKQISVEDWENTPENVKRLVESLLASVALSENQSRLIQFLDATPIAIAVHDSTGQLVYINHIGRALLGHDQPLELSLDQLSQVFQVYCAGSQELYPFAALPSTRSLSGEKVWVDDLEIHRGDRVIPLEVWATPIFDEQSQVTHAIVAFQDISERKSVEAERQRQEMEQQILENTLLKSESQYRQVIQVQTDLILRSLPDTTITFANDSLCLALGKSLPDVIGWQWSNFVPPENLDDLYGKIAALTPENPIFENINQDYRADNQIGWTQWINLGIFDEHGQLSEIQSVGRDITALQKQIQREQALNRVFQAIRNSLDLDTIFATATAETSQILQTLDCFVVQYLAEQGIWQHIAEFRHNPDTPTTIGVEIPDVGNPFAEQLKQLQMVRVENTANLEDEINQEIAHILPGAWLLIPLVIEGKLWGSFTITASQQPFIWNNDQIELAQSVADQLEIAIQQADLYQKLQLELTERRRVETALRESEARFQNMAANVPGAIFRYQLRTDGSDSVVYMSPGCYRLWEVAAEDVIADATLLWQMIHPEDYPGMRASVLESAQTLQPWIWAWRIITKSGQEKWLEASGRPTQQPNGDVIWDTLILDVTKRQQAEYRFQTLAANTPGVIYQYVLHSDGSNTMLYVSPGCRYLWELEPQEIEQDVEITWRMVHPDDLPAMRRSVLVSAQSLHQWNWEWRITTPSGRQKWLQASALPQRQANGDIIWDGLILDVSEWQAALQKRQQAEEALRESEARYRLLAENTNDLVCLHELNGRYLYISPSCEFLLGYGHQEMLRQDPYNFIHPEDRDRVYQEILTAVIGGKPTPITYRMLQKSGNYIWFETLTKPIVDGTGQIVQLQTTSRDITERIQVQNQLKHDALHDGLTGLPNRHLFMERLELAIQRAKRLENYHFAILFLDLDRFKVINDSLGHLAGDQLLIAIAQKLQTTLRAIDLPARLGGDEFVILLEEIPDIQEAVRITERILAELQAPVIIEGREVYMTSSVGIVLGTKDYLQASHLLRDADIAMYRAKHKGKARYEIFDTQMHTQALNRLHLENDLRRAIKSQEFVLHYQPIVALDTGNLVGFEALIRWQHPTQGLKLPGEFISVAEEIGLITSLDYWAMRTACSQMVAWQTAFPELSAMKVSVNLSAQDLRQPDLLAEVDRILTQTHLHGRCLTLEITESMLIEDIESTISLLSQLQERGIQISIDDFGTGYSSLNYLHRLPINSLKVDRSFVNQIQSGKKNAQIVETIVALSNHLELDAIAEGIETPAQLEWLQHLGYKFGQGYLFSQPLSHEQAEALLASRAFLT
ncbi:EAL domain-containing protein [Nostoc sp. TCL26-01]|uniref:EAL domain-containing protein n=1 Tax=Nostoc sp. TCL26-01 TaxID=2576904 RepID=UPI0015BD7FD1|nr:EAL domain-containing protein [Nostoc sp. TCL26-01]QLE55832.1 EAL domain-containing protein [Nostoc sp. TCL26-01]